MLTYKDVKVGKRYIVIKGSTYYHNMQLMCCYTCNIGAIFWTNDWCARDIRPSINKEFKYELTIALPNIWFEEIPDIKDKSWITRQLIAMI